YSTIIKPVSIPTSAPISHQPFTYIVASGENLKTIATKYRVSVAEIRWSNTNLYSSDSVATGDQIVIPPVHGVVVTTKAADPVGWCTYYVATKRNVTWNGDAGYWYQNAAASGYAVGPTPKVGSIMVTWESWAGHVAYVEAVNSDGSWVVSEMNWVAFDVIDER